MVVDHLAAAIRDLLDQVRMSEDPAVGDRAVGTRQVDLMDADDSQRQ